MPVTARRPLWLEQVGAGSHRAYSPFMGLWLYRDEHNKEVQLSILGGVPEMYVYTTVGDSGVL